MGCGSSAPSSTENPVAAAAAAAAEKEAADKKKADEEAAKKAGEEAAKKAGEEAAKKKADEEAEQEQQKAIKAAEEARAKQLADELAIEQEMQRKTDVSQRISMGGKVKFEAYERYIIESGGDISKEHILLSSLFGKLSPSVTGGYQDRQLILTSKPCIYYVDLVKKQSKGTIQWFHDGKVKEIIPEAIRGSDGKSFKIIAETEDGKNRVYEFKEVSNSKTCDTQASVDVWVAGIQSFVGCKHGHGTK